MDCPIELNLLLTEVKLNVLPLGSYDALIDMDWLEKNRVKEKFYENVIECIDEEERSILVKGIPN